MTPYTMKITTGPQSFIFETIDTKLNEDVTGEDFK